MLKKSNVDVSSVVFQVKVTNGKKRAAVNRDIVEGTLPEHNVDLFKPSKKSSTTNLNPRYTFDNFIVGSSNDLAYAASRAVADHPGQKYNPLFLYGGAGLGKTHLMQAIGNEIIRKQPKARVLYTTTEAFVNEFLEYIRFKKQGFSEKYRNVDVLIVDDMQFIAGKEKTQDEFFHTFNDLHQNDKQIIISSDKPPKSIPTLTDRLRSRFEWGMTIDIQMPDYETRSAIITAKASQSGMELDPTVVEYLATNIKTNIRELEGALNKVVAYARFHGRQIGLEVAKEALKDLLHAHNRQLSIEHIQKTVADYYKIKVADMHSKKRTRVIARPRQVAMWLAKELTPMSLPAIGEAFGGRDHTTVLHACRTITELRLGDHQLNHDVHVLTQVLRG